MRILKYHLFLRTLKVAKEKQRLILNEPQFIKKYTVVKIQKTEPYLTNDKFQNASPLKFNQSHVCHAWYSSMKWKWSLR